MKLIYLGICGGLGLGKLQVHCTEHYNYIEINAAPMVDTYVYIFFGTILRNIYVFLVFTLIYKLQIQAPFYVYF